jgi:hypothetical protein
VSKTSQNGWPVIPKGTDARLVAIPRVIGRVRAGDVAKTFTAFNERFDREVEDIDVGRDDWGYANRPIVGGTDASNHASGTAEDLNATRHPLGRVNTFTPAQRTALRKLLEDFPVIRWGGDYAGRKDEMHFEINASPAAVAAFAAALDAQLVDNPRPGPTPPPAVTKSKPKPLPPVIKKGSKGGWVGLWQGILRTQGENVAVDENFGPGTDAATRRVQKRWGLVPDGVVGPKTWLRALVSDRSGSLAYGDNGPQVELLQNLLGIKLDRNFGPATRDAVAQVQRYLGIRDDGAAGGATNAALRRHYRA